VSDAVGSSRAPGSSRETGSPVAATSLPPGARDARAIGGGYINDAYRVVLSDGRAAFVKTRADAVPGEYAAESAGLRWLAEPGALRTPNVLDVADGYLALEWVQPGGLDAAGGEELGRGLAATHAAGAPRFGSFAAPAPGSESEASAGPGAASVGHAGDVGWLGSLAVSNQPTDTWAEFYGERRLRPLTRLARERGALGDRALTALERVCARMTELAGPPEPPARLHGDLWSGNVLADASGRPWLIDPSAYGGHREVDLAMLALFGAPAGTLEAYREAAPLADGWRERVGLYQLLPLLVHALLFGWSYRDAVERTAQRYE
jgi:fructosamine-3-kinase